MNPHLKHYAVIKTLLKECKLELKGDAVIMAAESLSWFHSLDKILEAIHTSKAPAPKEEPIKKSKKAIKKNGV
jgi:hypothetical protein